MFKRRISGPEAPKIGDAVLSMLSDTANNTIGSNEFSAILGFMNKLTLFKTAGHTWAAEAAKVRGKSSPHIKLMMIEDYKQHPDTGRASLKTATDIHKYVCDIQYSTDKKDGLFKCYRTASQWAGHTSVMLESILTDSGLLCDAVETIYECYRSIPYTSFVYVDSQMWPSYVEEEEIQMHFRHGNYVLSDLLSGLNRFNHDNSSRDSTARRPARWFHDITDESLYSDLLRVAQNTGRLHRSKKIGGRWHYSIDEICEKYPVYADTIFAAVSAANAKS